MLTIDGGADGLIESVIEGVSNAAGAIVDAAKFVYEVGQDMGEVVAKWVWIPIFGKHQY